METYKINYKSHWANGWQVILTLILSVFGPFIGPILWPEDHPNLFIIAFGIFFIFQVGPQLALHVNYYLINKNDVLKYDKTYKEFIFVHDDKEIEFNIDDIVNVTFFKSRALVKGYIQIFAWDSYNHCVILLKNGKKITITSLLIGGEVKLPVDASKTQVKMYEYRWAIGPSIR